MKFKATYLIKTLIFELRLRHLNQSTTLNSDQKWTLTTFHIYYKKSENKFLQN